MKKYDKIAIYDFETNELYHALNQPIQVGMYIIDSKGNITKYSSLIKFTQPTRRLKPEIIKLTGITNEMLQAKGREMKTVMKEVSKLTDNRTLWVGHNIIAFDNLFLNYFMQYYGLTRKATEANSFDTSGQTKADKTGRKKLKSDSYGQFHKYILSKRIGGIKHNLGEAIDFYSVDIALDLNVSEGVQTFHNAEFDAEVTMRVFLRQCENMGFENCPLTKKQWNKLINTNNGKDKKTAGRKKQPVGTAKGIK